MKIFSSFRIRATKIAVLLVCAFTWLGFKLLCMPQVPLPVKVESTSSQTKSTKIMLLFSKIIRLFRIINKLVTHIKEEEETRSCKTP